MESCRYVSSWGGVARCGEEAYELGFCRFHFDCYGRGEIDVRGILSERISDQDRRREINFHGLRRASGRDS
jgi:hypothetical protein